MREDPDVGERYGSMREQYRKSGIRVVDLDQIPVLGNSRVPGNSVKSLFRAQDKARKLISLIRNEKVDVIDGHLAPPNPLCAVAAWGAGIPFTVTLYQVNEMKSAKLWLSGQLNLGFASQLITDSETQAAVLRKWLVHGPPVCVIPNGTLPPDATTSRELMLKLFNISDRQPMTIVGQVSSLISYKGQLVLIDAARQVLERHPECIFLLVGYERTEPGYKESLLKRADELGVREQVRIVSYPGPIGDVWNIIDIHAHPSLLDSLPNALLEAMSLGKPSVATSVGGIPEVIKNGTNGLLVPAGSSEQLAHHLLMLLDDSRLKESIGREAKATYSRDFSPFTMTRRLEAIFRNLAESRSRFGSNSA